MRRSILPATRQSEVPPAVILEYGLTGALVIVVIIATIQIFLRLF
ncbi:MAG TPA: hypothetical protein VK759_05840 [Rhizomicrobium sp.]|nr:hypothetical protein [Rhizomicrobium sp.]